MLYSEFIDRVGRVRTVEDYHTKVNHRFNLLTKTGQGSSDAPKDFGS